MPGRLITIEGLDGSGKTTLAAGLLDAVRAAGHGAELLREPGGVEVSERLRALVKDPALTVGARAEALIYAAARAQLVEEALRPLLAGGTWVLLDRFVDSSLAYQGGGRGLGVAEVAELNRFATRDLTPDRTLYLRVDPAVGRERTGTRLEGFTGSSSKGARSSIRSPPRTTSSPPPTRSGSGCSTPPRRRRPCSQTRSPRWRTCSAPDARR